MKHKFMKRGLDKFSFFLTLFLTLPIIHVHLVYENRAPFSLVSFTLISLYVRFCVVLESHQREVKTEFPKIKPTIFTLPIYM